MNQSEQNSNIAAEEEIDVIELFKVLWAQKLMITFLTIVFTAGSIAYALYLPNIYTAEATLSPVNSDGNSISGGLGALGGLASLAGISTSGGGDTAANIAVVKSRKFIMEFIEENNLLPIFFSKEWDSDNNKWLIDDENKLPTLQKGYMRFMGDVLSITENKKTGLITLRISWYDPNISAKWANMLIEKANLFLKRKAISEATESISYLKEQIKNTKEVRVQELLYKLTEKELQTAKLASVRKDYAFKVLDPALAPEDKSKPQRIFLVLIGGLIGFILSIGIALVRNFSN